ncbi:RNA polymerase sigma factor [Nannocystis pusilla]|uniref:RNA polymerase sigma factor n=1 Tax=Nannocystis pusilla TaxID=889268 RepID=UPI003B81AA29
MTLSRTDRLAFLLAAEGCSSVEIAERFSLTHDAVRSRLKRARKVLRAALEARDTLPAPRRTASASPTKGSLPDDDLAQFFASPPAPHR